MVHAFKNLLVDSVNALTWTDKCQLVVGIQLGLSDSCIPKYLAGNHISDCWQGFQLMLHIDDYILIMFQEEADNMFRD